MRKPSTARVRGSARVGLAALALALGGSVALVGCGSDSPSSDPSGAGAGSSAEAQTTSTAAPAAKRTYLSLGDSYAQGYQPTVDGKKPDYRKGFAYLVPEKAAGRGYDLDLVNLGCGGATVGSLADQPGCIEPARAPDGPAYEVSQLQAAVDYLERHEREVDLITVSIGGNDVTTCAKGDKEPIPCVTEAVGKIKEKLGVILPKLRAAAGPDTVIVGLTYPDVILGSYLSENAAAKELASLSAVAFEQFINPMLKEQYEAVDGIFVDVTAATGAYTPFTDTTTDEEYGEIPTAVAEVCDLTWFCERQDIHPRDEGYAEIADLIVAALPER